MKSFVYNLPKKNGRDMVSEIQMKKEATKKKARNKCFGSNSCDCKLCNGR